MNVDDLHRAVAARTGEPIREIARRGFVPLTRIPVELEPDSPRLDHEATEPLDWDDFEHLRIGIVFPQCSRPATIH